ncbi:hypothetical protein LIER_34494 [Lithospermum erythrorhizon]|uniref:High chlorophyll fluorescence 153 n=1 Tax=Lithospermum erythrorhizon TaxID=34254 RepID=A0AAV3RZP1_LITER
MASLSLLSTPFSSLSLSHHHKPPPSPSSSPLLSSSSATQYLAINYQICYRKSSRTSGRGLSVVTHAGPSSASYIFAFVFPLSLLVVTIFAASRVADKLDQQFLEELAINQEILEADEDYDGDGDGDGAISIEQEPAPARGPPRRNRPKREVESTST